MGRQCWICNNQLTPLFGILADPQQRKEWLKFLEKHCSSYLFMLPTMAFESLSSLPICENFNNTTLLTILAILNISRTLQILAFAKLILHQTIKHFILIHKRISQSLRLTE